MNAELQGIGMTSRRTRMRLVQRLRDEGISDEQVLAAIGEVPRHIFLDEALNKVISTIAIHAHPSRWEETIFERLALYARYHPDAHFSG